MSVTPLVGTENGTEWLAKINEIIEALPTSGTGASGMVVSERDYTNPTYIYIGGLVVDAWEVRRYSRSTGVQTVATITNNSGVASLSAAWAARTTLTYA